MASCSSEQAPLHGSKLLTAAILCSILGAMNARGIRIEPSDVSFFLGRESLVFTGKSKMSLPRKVFFKVMSQNAVAASAFFKLPPGRVIELGMQVDL